MDAIDASSSATCAFGVLKGQCAGTRVSRRVLKRPQSCTFAKVLEHVWSVRLDQIHKTQLQQLQTATQITQSTNETLIHLVLWTPSGETGNCPCGPSASFSAALGPLRPYSQLQVSGISHQPSCGLSLRVLMSFVYKLPSPTQTQAMVQSQNQGFCHEQLDSFR